MPGSRRAWAAVPALVAAAGFAWMPRPAYGAEVEVVAVDYRADGTCIPETQFLDNVRRYTTRWRVASSTTASGRTFRIVLDKRHGELVVEGADGKATRREIGAPDCERVARGIAIAMALAIDPEADITGAPADASRDEAATSKQEEGEGALGAGAASEDVPASPPAIAPPPRAERRGEAKPPPPRLALALEARAEVTSSIAAVVAPTFGVAVEARARPHGAPDWLVPALAIGLRQSWPSVVEGASGRSEFVWTAGTVRVCPVRLHVRSPAVDFVPCAEGNAGVLRARALPDGQTTPSTWVDFGGSLRAVLGIGESWGLGVAALVSAPFIRHRFALVGGGLVSQPPPVGITGGVLLERRL